tara:strand:- start:5511 stop:6197 length:687 start_codon:yes stop_codon:yes gene_type:complete
MDLKEQIKTALGLNTVKLEWQSKMEDGTILVSTADTLEEGSDISVLVEDGTTILLPAGSYKTEDNLTFVVEEEGIVASVEQSKEEEVEEVEEEEMAEDKKEEDEDEMKEKKYADVEDWEGMEKRIQNLEDAVASLKADKMDAGEEVEEMAEEPGSNPKSIKTTEVVEFSVEELKEQNEILKAELSKAPASGPLVAEKFSTHKATPILTKQQIANMDSSTRFLYDLNNN